MSYNSYNRRPSQGRRRPTSAGPSKRRGVKENIHPSRFVKAASVQAVSEFIPNNSFRDFDMHQLLGSNVAARGYHAPSPIQDQAIPAGLAGRDVIGVANTGTGKTIAFALPVLNKLLTERGSRALIMAPTRELAGQIEDELRSISRSSGLNSALLIGGASMSMQLHSLRRQPAIVIGTPGRIKDHIERKSLDLTFFNVVVLDEVDRMLDMGFIHDMRLILKRVGHPRQSFFFSATLDPRVKELIQEFSTDPVTISVKTGETLDNVEQSVVSYTGDGEKLDKLHDLLIKDSPKALVFHATKRSADRLSKELQGRGFRADVIHGGKSQGQRQRALNRFKANEITVLVATDVAARGIDVVDITHVINYSTPNSYDDYVHRIGRAGRAGRTGRAMTFVEK